MARSVKLTEDDVTAIMGHITMSLSHVTNIAYLHQLVVIARTQGFDHRPSVADAVAIVQYANTWHDFAAQMLNKIAVEDDAAELRIRLRNETAK